MTEQEYINATNKALVTAAYETLRLVDAENMNPHNADATREIRRNLHRLEKHLNHLIKIEESE